LQTSHLVIKSNTTTSEAQQQSNYSLTFLPTPLPLQSVWSQCRKLSHVCINSSTYHTLLFT